MCVVACDSWTEFSAIPVKVERYTRAVTSIDNLLTWWDSLSSVDQASAKSIATLLTRAESIISSEQASWNSTASTKKDGDEKEKKEGGGEADGSSSPREGKGKGAKVSPEMGAGG